VLEARGLRARWNAYRDEPELTSGYGASFVVRATAGALTRHPHDSTLYGQTVLSTEKNTSARARSVASWALEHRASLVRAAALAEARRAHALVLMQCREHPNVSSEIDGGDEAKRQKSALCDFVVHKNVFGDVSASDLRVVAETGNGIVSGFSGLVVAACASASERRRLSDGGATKRVTAWVAQDSSGVSTEVTLKAMPADKADALAESLPGSAARFSDFLVFARADERGRRTYALVQRDDAGTTGIPGDGDGNGDGDGDASWCVLPEGDARAEALAARCSARRASAEAPSLRSLSDLERGSSPFERRASFGPNDASVVVVRARVAWVRLPRASSSSRPTSLKEKEKKIVTKREEKKKKRFAKKTRGVPATRAEIAASLIAPGCVLCLRELAPDPADGAFRQCACHSGRANAVGWVWRALELGLVDADDERRQKMFKTNDRITESNNDSEEASDAGGFRDDPASIRVARVDASLVSRLLLGASAAEAAAAARDGNEASGEDVLQEESFSRKRRRTKAEGEVDHLSLAAAAINALAAGPARNATPIVWHLRAPPPDSNGVRFADGAPLEVIDFDVVDFVSAGKAA
jgi:hypothetical protein